VLHSDASGSSAPLSAAGLSQLRLSPVAVARTLEGGGRHLPDSGDDGSQLPSPPTEPSSPSRPPSPVQLFPIQQQYDQQAPTVAPTVPAPSLLSSYQTTEQYKLKLLALEGGAPNPLLRVPPAYRDAFSGLMRPRVIIAEPVCAGDDASAVNGAPSETAVPVAVCRPHVSPDIGPAASRLGRSPLPGDVPALSAPIGPGCLIWRDNYYYPSVALDFVDDETHRQRFVQPFTNLVTQFSAPGSFGLAARHCEASRSSLVTGVSLANVHKALTVSHERLRGLPLNGVAFNEETQFLSACMNTQCHERNEHARIHNEPRRRAQELTSFDTAAVRQSILKDNGEESTRLLTSACVDGATNVKAAKV
jgi:hypothetical protein